MSLDPTCFPPGARLNRMRFFPHAFTLVELLIVVAIIALLAAIAVPNFLEAQTRSKVARVKADMRSLSTAIESYAVDRNAYPVRRHTADRYMPEKATRLQQMSAVTSPIAYISSLPVDPFETIIPPPNNVLDYWDAYQYMRFVNHFQNFRPSRHISEDTAGWLLVSVGPDGYMGQSSNVSFSDPWPLPEGEVAQLFIRATVTLPYDPTNGSTSVGNIYGAKVGGIDRGGDTLYQRLRP